MTMRHSWLLPWVFGSSRFTTNEIHKFDSNLKCEFRKSAVMVSFKGRSFAWVSSRPTVNRKNCFTMHSWQPADPREDHPQLFGSGKRRIRGIPATKPEVSKSTSTFSASSLPRERSWGMRTSHPFTIPSDGVEPFHPKPMGQSGCGTPSNSVRDVLSEPLRLVIGRASEWAGRFVFTPGGRRRHVLQRNARGRKGPER